MKIKGVVSASLIGALVIVTSVLSYMFISNSSNHNSKKEEEPPKIRIKEKVNNEEYRVVDNIELSLGSNIPVIFDFIKEENIVGSLEIYFNDSLITTNTLEEIGEYQVIIKIANKEYTSKIMVKDNDAPELTLNDVTITENKKYDINSFVKECSDNSRQDCILTFKEEKMGTYTKVGSYEIEVIAKDEANNETISKASLKITENKKTNNTTNSITSNNTNNNSNNTSTNTNNNSNTSTNSGTNNNSDNSNNNDSDTKPIKTTTRTEETSEVSYKYGIKITKSTTITYDVYSDGTEKEINREHTYLYDKSAFKATTAELKEEATTLMNNNKTLSAEVLKYVNELRAKEGVPALVLDNEINLASNIRALETGYSGYFSHTRPDGSDCFTVITDLNIGFSALGENIALGSLNAKGVVNLWESSSGHRANMVNSKYTKMGLGYIKIDGKAYWVQMFAS